MKGMFDYEVNKCEEAILEVFGEYADDDATTEGIHNFTEGMGRVEFIYGDHTEGSDVKSLYQSALKQAKEQTAVCKADALIVMQVSERSEQDIAKLILFLPELMSLAEGNISFETRHRKSKSDCDRVIFALLYKASELLS